MAGGGSDGAQARAMTYCVVPRDLADRLHGPLRRHFAADPTIEVVVERRASERRAARGRRTDAAAPDTERRSIRAEEGRRVADRRAAALPVEVDFELPRKARPFAARLVFIERCEPTTQQLEDRDTARLVMRVQAGDRDAFSEIYMRYFDRVFNYLRVALGSDHDAEDAAQHVFLNVLNALPRYERSASRPFRAWLFTIVRNHAINQVRQRQRSEPVEPERLERRREREVGVEIDLSALSWVSDRELVMLVRRLPAVQQQVLMLRFQLDLSTADIASILGRSVDDVRGLQSRALRFLSERLTALGRGPEVRGGHVRARLFPKYAPVLRGRRFALH